MPFQPLDIELPKSLLISRRRYFRLSEIRHLKASLIARGMGQKPPKKVDVDPRDDQLVPAAEVMRDLGIARRTLYRKMKESDAPRAARSN
jgi:hypothetical protein